MKRITSTKALSLTIVKLSETTSHELIGTIALLRDAQAELDQVHEAIKQQPAIEALITATESFIYDQPQTRQNWKVYEPLLQALWNLGYRYCEGCDHIKESTKERPDLQSLALCNECDHDERNKAKAEPEPFPYDQVEIDAQQRQHERDIEVDNVRDIMDTIDQGDIDAFLENKYKLSKPSRYYLSDQDIEGLSESER